MSAVDIEIRQAVHPDHAEAMDTGELRENFLVTELFKPGRIKAVYTHYDRMVLLGIAPGKLPLGFGPELTELVKSDDFLARREIAIFNVGGLGHVMAGGKRFELGRNDALYLPMGTHNVLFESAKADDPALFYANSAPAHAAHPAQLVKVSALKGDLLGAQETANRRILTKYMHPGAFPTCQLVTGRTELQPGNVWNSIPPHTHDRRMEAYFYHGIPDGQAVFHFMGRPDSTRHIVIRNHEAVISPPWSIHCGAGTSAYAFIWSMAGDNQTFTDMDAVPVSTIF